MSCHGCISRQLLWQTGINVVNYNMPDANLVVHVNSKHVEIGTLKCPFVGGIDKVLRLDLLQNL